MPNKETPSKKKRTPPRFDIHDEAAVTAESGWVYRSAAKGPSAARTRAAASAAECTNPGIFDDAAQVAAYSMAAAGHLLLLGARVVTMPATVMLRTFGK
jgi:hypothetical protein